MYCVCACMRVCMCVYVCINGVSLWPMMGLSSQNASLGILSDTQSVTQRHTGYSCVNRVTQRQLYILLHVALLSIYLEFMFSCDL